MVKLYDRIILAEDISKVNLVKGDVGTVVEIYNDGEGFEVEFFALDGSTLTVETLLKHQVRSVNKKEIMHIRSFL